MSCQGQVLVVRRGSFTSQAETGPTLTLFSYWWGTHSPHVKSHVLTLNITCACQYMSRPDIEPDMPGGYANHYVICASPVAVTVTGRHRRRSYFKQIRDHHHLRFFGGHNYRSPPRPSEISWPEQLHGAAPIPASNCSLAYYKSGSTPLVLISFLRQCTWSALMSQCNK